MASSQQHADGCVRLARYGFLLVFYRKSAEPCNLQEEKKEEEEEKNVFRRLYSRFGYARRGRAVLLGLAVQQWPLVLGQASYQEPCVRTLISALLA